MRHSIKIYNTGQKVGCQKGLRSQKEKFYTTTKNKAGFQEEISFKAHIKSQVKSGHERW